MNEKLRRRWAGSEAVAYGEGGITAVTKATGLAWNTIKRGVVELQDKGREVSVERVRQAGGGRKRLTDVDEELMRGLEQLVDPVTRGDPESPLRWTCKSTYQLASALSEQRGKISPSSVGRLLKQAGYSLQGNQKTLEGRNHPDRNAQFEYISKRVRQFQDNGQPVISVDTKKKELVGRFYKSGREWRPQGEAEEVKVHDFMDKELGKAIPYGVYDITNNAGWVSVGIDHDTAEFAAAAIERWWSKLGRHAFPVAKELMLNCGWRR